MSCLICLDSTGHLISTHDDFQHQFHPDCLKMWLTKSKAEKCPFCHESISQNALIISRIQEELLEIFREKQTEKFKEFLRWSKFEICDLLDYIVNFSSIEFLRIILRYLLKRPIRLDLAYDLSIALLSGKYDFATAIFNTIHAKPFFLTKCRSWEGFLSSVVYSRRKDMMIFILEQVKSNDYISNFLEDCQIGSVERVTFWIDCIPNLSNEYLYDGLCNSAQSGNLQTCVFLMKCSSGRTFFDDHHRLLRLISMRRYWSILPLFGDISFSPSCDYHFTLAMAISDQNWKLVKELFRNGARIETVKLSECLLPTVKLNDIAGIRTLLNHGANPNYNGCEALVEASKRWQISLCRMLLEYDVGVNCLKEVLEIALCSSNEQLVELILTKIDGTEYYFENTLVIASKRSSRAILKILREFIYFRSLQDCRFSKYLKIVERKLQTPGQLVEYYLNNIQIPFLTKYPQFDFHENSRDVLNCN